MEGIKRPDGMKRPTLNDRARAHFRSPWLIVRANPVDWFRLLADLQGFGYSNADVARAINVAPSTLAEWKQGIEPKFENGRALVMLHASVCEIRHTESPGSP